MAMEQPVVDEQPLPTGLLAEEVPLPDDPWEHGGDPWRRSSDAHSGGANAANAGPPPGFGDGTMGGVFPGGPAGPPMSYGPTMVVNGSTGMTGPCQCPGGFVPQGPGGCGGAIVHPGPCNLPGPGVCHGPGMPPGPTVSQGPCPLPGYGVCHGVGMSPGCGGFQPVGGPYGGCGCGVMNGWPTMMWNGFGGVPGTGVYGGSQSWSKPTTPPDSRPRPSTRGGSRGGGNPPDPDDDDDEGGSTSREDTRSSTAATSEIRSMLRRKHHRDGNDSRPKSSLGSVKIEEYYGDRSRYIKWKRAIEAQQHLYALNEGELSMLIYLSTRKEARDVVEQHPIHCYTGSGGLQLLWKVMDEAFGESEAELFERADKELERCRRQPGESIAHFLAEMRRLRAQYYHIDPDSRISDKAWGQKLLQKASLSRRERLDCYYAAGACYDSLEIEKALRVRCGRIHEDEKKVSQPRERTYDNSRNPGGSGYTKKKVFVRRRVNHTHLEQGVEEDEDFDEMEPIEEEVLDETMEPEGSIEEVVSSAEEVDEEELKEVFAAGWKAKQKTAEVRKNRGWRKPDPKGGRPSGQSTDARKKVTTCSSCGKMGHWRGDMECPNVQSGQDAPHQKKSGGEARANGANEVHFTFMVGGAGSRGLPEVPPGHCHHCRWVLAPTARFCQQCGVPVPQDERMSRSKRERRSDEDDDRWDLVGEAEPFTFGVPKERVRSLLGGGSRVERSEGDHIRLSPRSLMTTLPEMSKDEKKRLKDALQRDEESEAWRSLERHRVLLQEMEQEARHGGEVGYHRTPMSGVSRGSDDQRPIIPMAKPLLQPPKGDKPRPVKERELQEFREALIARQWKNGKLRPSEASPVPTELQARCDHPPDRLRWTANGEGHQARCRACDLKNVIYFSTRHGVLMVSREDEDAEKVRRMIHVPPSPAPSNIRVKVKYVRGCMEFQDVSFEEIGAHELHCRITKDVDGNVVEVMRGRSEGKMKGPVPGGPRPLVTEFWYTPAHQPDDSLGVFIEGGSPGLAIADSGCRNAVGGLWWHNTFQNHLRERKLPFERVEEREVYRFGAGEPVVSTVAYIYPVGVHGKPDVVRISVVEKEAIACPGLIGPSELQRWGAVFKFATKEMQLQDVVKPKMLTSTRHPGIDLTDAVELSLQRFWHSEEGQNRRRKLVYDPQSLAFVATGDDEDSADETGSSGTGGIWGDPDEYEEARENFKRKWLSQLEDALEQPYSEDGEAEAEESEGSMTDDPSEPTEESSHERGVEIVSDTSEDDEDIREEAQERENEVYWTASSKKIMNKGLKRKLGHCAKEIREGFQHEKRRDAEKGAKKKSKEVFDRTRRSRPFSVLEVFTWTCAISLMAASRGWTAHEPVTLPGWDLLKDSDYKAALEYIDQVSPDLLVVAWPCTKWSRLQTLGRKSVLQLARLVAARKKQRKLLRFSRDAVMRQRKRKGRVLGENPATSLAWKEPLIVEAFDGLAHEITDMCCFNLKVPGKGALRKRTGLAGHRGVMKYCVKKCCCKKKHVPVLGSAKIGGRWRSVSDFAGGYTMEFAEAVIRGAEEDLENDVSEAEVFVEGGVPEEIWRHEEEDEEAEDQADEDGDVAMTDDTEKIKKGSVRWKVRALHQRLGHPTKATLRRMLVLSGASKEVIHEAENYDCPVCLETAMPGRYLKQRAEVRPVSFGKELHCDLKYIHDHGNKLFVALSVVDAATSFHMAVLLRSRAAGHVARKFQRHWCSLHGCPEEVILDQGGEFDGAFIAWLEAHGIHSKVSGARSAWQHGFAERHGAVLGTMCTSLIWQYQAKGASQVKDCLCVAVQAKNMTLTRKGYTPYQMVFGRSPLFPDLLEEDTAGNMALRDSLTMEGEVSRAAEMRAAARAVLLRQDVQQKLKRALTRMPRGEDREYDPGEKVFFYVPTPKTARFRRGGGFWRGPAMVIMRESAQRYYVSWRGRCLLVSAPNLRPASELEALDQEERREEARALEENLEKKEYEDISNQALPDDENPEDPEEGPSGGRD